MITKDRLQKAVKGESKPQPDPRVAKESEVALAIVNKFEEQFKLLNITTPEMYIEADKLRAKVEARIEWWDGLIEPIVRPQRQALDATYALGRTVKRPLEQLKIAIRSAMEGYKLEEARQIREAQKKIEEAQQAVDSEVERLRKQKEQAATPQLQKRFEKKINDLQERALKGEIEEDRTTPIPVIADKSTTRFGYDWELVDLMEVIKAVATGKIPKEVLTIDSKWVREYFSRAPQEVMEWPGFKVKEVVNIVKNRGQ